VQSRDCHAGAFACVAAVATDVDQKTVELPSVISLDTPTTASHITSHDMTLTYEDVTSSASSADHAAMKV